MGMRGIERVLDAMDPFYTTSEITQEECKGYLKAIETALAPHGVKLHRDPVYRLNIEGLDGMVQLAQVVTNGAAQISLRRYQQKKEILLTVFTEYNRAENTYIPRALEVHRGNEKTHNYFW